MSLIDSIRNRISAGLKPIETELKSIEPLVDLVGKLAEAPASPKTSPSGWFTDDFTPAPASDTTTQDA